MELIQLDFCPAAAALPFNPEPAGPHRGGALALYTTRACARPVDRWVDVLVDIATDVDLTNATLRVTLHDTTDATLLAQAQAAPSLRRGFISIDMREIGRPAARLRAELSTGATLLGAGEMFLTARPAAALPADFDVAVALDLPAGARNVTDYPVTFGIPFPPGALWDTTSLRVTDQSGAVVPFQAEPTGYWARDGAIKWVRFDALVDAAKGCRVTTVPKTPSATPPALTVHAADGQAIVETGGARYTLRPGAALIADIQVGGRSMVSDHDRHGLYVIDQNGRLAATATDNQMEVEAAGPITACIRFEGFYRTADGEPLARHITRLEFFAGRPEARVTHTLIITRDTNEIWFKEVGWDLGVDAGRQPRGVFSLDPADATATATIELAAGASAWICQEDYIQFHGGTQAFTLAQTDGNGLTNIVRQGADMGDWAALTGEAGGLVLACRAAARQHPKDIELTASGAILRLFSPRAGDELDFRAPALVQRWNRGGLLDQSKPIDPAKAAKLTSDATGWSKTHELMLWPLDAAGAQDIPAMSETVRLFSAGVYAHADPHWIYASQAMGPLYPKDPARFAAAETFIQTVFDPYIERGHAALNEYGFMDYFAGPHYRGIGSNGSPRYHLTYVVRLAAWTLYARSGERRLREFAEGTNRRFLDNQLAHWSDHRKNRGIYFSTYVGANQPYYGNLPFYWETGTSPYGGGGPNSINQFLFDYHLTGYRRAGEVAANYAAGMQEWWQPGKAAWYRLKVLRNLTLAYGETWDRALLPIIEDYLSQMYDPAGAVCIERDGMPHGGITIYKVEEDLQGIIQAAQITGDPRFEMMARRLAEWTVYRSIGKPPFGTRFEKGNAAHYLFEQTGDMTIVEDVARTVREAVVAPPLSGISHASPRILGLPFMLALVAEHDADRRPVTSWLYYEQGDTPTCAVIRKQDIRDILDFRLQGADKLTLLPASHMPARPLLYDYHFESGVFHLRVPRDAGNTKQFKGPYEFLIKPEGGRRRFLIASTRTPLVLFAPGPWRPLPDAQQPPVKIFFQVPADIEKAAICFGGAARLFNPAGQVWPTPAPMTGWTELPADQPGLWAFEPVEPGQVETRNLPPFFAFGDPEFYFTPAAIPNLQPPAATDAEDDNGP